MSDLEDNLGFLALIFLELALDSFIQIYMHEPSKEEGGVGRRLFPEACMHILG